jgi:hypothetical protein
MSATDQPTEAERDRERALAPTPVNFVGTARAGAALLRSPVSGLACVHWRLRIVERLTARTELVHEVASDEPFELAWGAGDADGAVDVEVEPSARPPGRPELRVRIAPESARIQATPVLHREGSPGALAVARHFNFSGAIAVQEVVIRVGQALTAEGVLDDLDAAVGAAPFRGTGRGPELLDATVILASRGLGPALLPWALGTAAALMSGMGLATYAAWRTHVLHLPAGSSLRLLRPSSRHAVIGPVVGSSLGPVEIPRPRLP